MESREENGHGQFANSTTSSREYVQIFLSMDEFDYEKENIGIDAKYAL